MLTSKVAPHEDLARTDWSKGSTEAGEKEVLQSLGNALQLEAAESTDFQLEGKRRGWEEKRDCASWMID